MAVSFESVSEHMAMEVQCRSFERYGGAPLGQLRGDYSIWDRCTCAHVREKSC
jgi:hypothetical protein